MKGCSAGPGFTHSNTSLLLQSDVMLLTDWKGRRDPALWGVLVARSYEAHVLARSYEAHSLASAVCYQIAAARDVLGRSLLGLPEYDDADPIPNADRSECTVSNTRSKALLTDVGGVNI